MNTPILNDLMPLFVLAGILLAIWAILSWISQRNARTRKRRGEMDGDEANY
jgi:hypothetical protein